MRGVRAIVQRVTQASVSVDGEQISRIGPGLLVLLGAREAQIDRKHLRELIRKYGLDPRAKLDGDEDPTADD